MTIQDTLLDNLSVIENIKIDIINNNPAINNLMVNNSIKNNFTFTAPDSAYALFVNNVSFANNGSPISMPLNCTNCQIMISFHLDNVVENINSTEYDYSRNLGLPQIPSVLTYSAILPVGYYLIPNHNTSMNPSIVPQPTSIDTNGKNIVIRWTENNPSLPKTYFVKYYRTGEIESASETIGKELGEPTVWWMMLIVLIAGLAAGFFVSRYYHRKENFQNNKNITRTHTSKDANAKSSSSSIAQSSTVPQSLLNPDEKTIITLLQDNHETMTQRDIGRKLEWSKSKVSAIMTNLEYKKIVEREKIGRNYKVELKKRLGDG